MIVAGDADFISVEIGQTMPSSSAMRWLRQLTLLVTAVAAAAFWLRSPAPTDRAPLLDINVNELLRRPVRAETTVVLVVGTDCPYTRSSVPFYRTLLSEQPEASFLIAGYEAPEVLQAFATEVGLTGVPVAQLAPAATAHIGATPTLLYLSLRNVPTRVWVGFLSPQAQQDARIALRTRVASDVAR